jgi:Tfp pilus assembly protein PilX
MRRLLRQEEGIALLMALGFTVVLVILVSSMIAYTSSGSRNSNISRSRVAAQSLAEAGIAAAASIINHSSNASSPSLLGCSVSGANANNSATPCTDLAITGVGGTAYVHGMYVSGSPSGTWTISAYGDVANPTGGGASSDVKRPLTATLTVVPGGMINNLSVWNYVLSTSPQGAGCELDISGNNVVVDVPVYVTGDLCISGLNASIMENGNGQKVDVMTVGKVVISGNNAHIGSSVAPITSGVAGQGCTSTIGGTGHACTTADKWYVTTTDTLITATSPTTDYPGWYQNASPGPKNACGAGTPSPVLAASSFDNDATMNGTSPVFNLTPASDYNCVTAGGTLSWNHTTHLLTLAGTIFFDGSLTASDTLAMYHGRATIYSNGKFTLSGNNASLRAGCPASPLAATHQCAFASTSTEWDPNKDNLLIVTDVANGTSVDFSGQNIQYQGGLMCTPTSTASFTGNNVQVEGPIICGKYSWGNNVTLNPLPSIFVQNLPLGAPNWPATVGQPTITSG